MMENNVTGTVPNETDTVPNVTVTGDFTGVQNATSVANVAMTAIDSVGNITYSPMTGVVDFRNITNSTMDFGNVTTSMSTFVADNVTVSVSTNIVEFENYTDTMPTTIFRTTFEAGVDNSSVDYDAILKMEDRYEAKLLTPVTVYLVILMIIGVFGNSLVLYVYKFRFKRSTSRVFILSLAVFDLLTCLFGMPFHILDMVYPYTFVWDELCKTLSFSLTFTILASIFVLDLIAIDRYRKICFPFEKQLSAAGTKITCWVTALIAAVLAVPIIFIYGSAEVKTRIYNVTGRECYISNDLEDTDIPMIYDGFNILTFLISVIVLTVLYIKVGIVVWKRRSFHDSMRDGSTRSYSGTSSPDTILSNVHAVNDDVRPGTPPNVRFNKGNHENSSVHFHNTKSPICKSNSLASYNSPKVTRKEQDLHKQRLKRLMSEISSVSSDEGTLERAPGNSKFSSKKSMRTIRITTMLFIITLIFVVSFLPYLIISIMNGLDETFWTNMSTAELVIINLLMRSYFINNMINPIIYWFLDKKFKQEVLRFFKDMRKCNWSKTFRLDHKSYTS